MKGREVGISCQKLRLYDGVISLAETCLLAKRSRCTSGSYKGQELYLGLIAELENLHVYDRLLIKRSGKKADSQRETHNGYNPEAVNR
jgi:hypothetical protein